MNFFNCVTSLFTFTCLSLFCSATASLNCTFTNDYCDWKQTVKQCSWMQNPSCENGGCTFATNVGRAKCTTMGMTATIGTRGTRGIYFEYMIPEPGGSLQVKDSRGTILWSCSQSLFLGWQPAQILLQNDGYGKEITLEAHFDVGSNAFFAVRAVQEATKMKASTHCSAPPAKYHEPAGRNKLPEKHPKIPKKITKAAIHTLDRRTTPAPKHAVRPIRTTKTRKVITKSQPHKIIPTHGPAGRNKHPKIPRKNTNAATTKTRKVITKGHSHKIIPTHVPAGRNNLPEKHPKIPKKNTKAAIHTLDRRTTPAPKHAVRPIRTKTRKAITKGQPHKIIPTHVPAGRNKNPKIPKKTTKAAIHTLDRRTTPAPKHAVRPIRTTKTRKITTKSQQHKIIPTHGPARRKKHPEIPKKITKAAIHILDRRPTPAPKHAVRTIGTKKPRKVTTKSQHHKIIPTHAPAGRNKHPKIPKKITKAAIHILDRRTTPAPKHAVRPIRTTKPRKVTTKSQPHKIIPTHAPAGRNKHPKIPKKITKAAIHILDRRTTPSPKHAVRPIRTKKPRKVTTKSQQHKIIPTHAPAGRNKHPKIPKKNTKAAIHTLDRRTTLAPKHAVRPIRTTKKHPKIPKKNTKAAIHTLIRRTTPSPKHAVRTIRTTKPRKITTKSQPHKTIPTHVPAGRNTHSKIPSVTGSSTSSDQHPEVKPVNFRKSDFTKLSFITPILWGTISVIFLIVIITIFTMRRLRGHKHSPHMYTLLHMNPEFRD